MSNENHTLFPLHFHLQVRMQKHSRCVVRNTSLLLLQFLFTCDTSNREVSFLIFSSWVRIVISQVGKVHLLRFRHFYVFNLSSRPCLIGVGIWFFIFGLFWKDQMTVLLSSKYMLSILVFNLA